MRDMFGRGELITAEQARELILRHATFKRPDEICLPIDSSFDMIISKDVFSPENLPAFSRSTVDGFAANSADTFGATETLPAYLNVKGEISMGEEPQFRLGKSEVAKIFTGGMLPDGADSVVMLEHIQQLDEKMIEIVKSVSPGENVIQIGEDARKGERILEKGHRLRPQDVGVLAALGITDVWVYKKPAVSIISTGDEIVPVDGPVKPGQVRDINSYTLTGLVLKSGAIPLRKGLFIDDYKIIRDAVQNSMRDSHMILITGGSSVGEKDMTARIINDIGKPGVLFHGVSLKPGKPLIGGIVDDIPVFGLPGHPAAVNVCFKVVIEPVLQFLSGLNNDYSYQNRRIVRARIARNISSGPGREEHIAVTLEEREGETWAIPILGKSGLITTLTRADGTAVIPLRKFGVQEGDVVEVRLF
ncbi:MAG: gephyrin-like molybdotransferase Glp [Nitrospirota bacterium]